MPIVSDPAALAALEAIGLAERQPTLLVFDCIDGPARRLTAEQMIERAPSGLALFEAAVDVDKDGRS